MLKRFLLVLALLLAVQKASANTYYVSSVIGSDSNTSTQAQSKTTPWAHAPGMANCASACASYSPVAADKFVLRGGDTWTSSSMPWSWQWNGSAGNDIYIGVDQTWFAGSSWVRPIITCSNSCAKQFNANSATYFELDNFEWIGLHSTAASPGFGSIYSINANGASNYLVIHNYFHGWSITHDGEQGAVVFYGDNSQDGLTSGELTLNAFDGSDVCNPNSTCTMAMVYGGPALIHDNYFGYASNGIVGGGLYLVYGNTMEYIVLSPDNGTDHENAIEDNGSNQLIMFNNVLRHIYNQGIVDFQMAPNAGKTDYAFNNVLPDMDGGNMQQCYEGAAGKCYWLNNTAEAGPDSGNPSGDCGRNTGSTTSLIINQDCITTQTGNSWWNGSATFTTSTARTKAAANAQGYSNSQTYAFSPTAATGSTVLTGTSEVALCNTISVVSALAGAACKNDTTYGVIYSTSGHTVTAGARTPNPRPTTANWDKGAYQFGTNSPPPVPGPIIITDTFGPCAVGSSCSGQVAASGGTPPYVSYAINPNLPGVALAATSGIFSGTPTTAGTYAVTLTVADSAGVTGAVATSLVVTSVAPPVVTPCTLTVSPTSFKVAANVGSSATPLSFTVSDSCPPIETFSSSVNVPWLTVTSKNPNTDANNNANTVAVNTSGLAASTTPYPGVITVTMANQGGYTFPLSPFSIPVSLTILSVAPPPPPAVACTQKNNSSTKVTVTATITNFPVGSTLADIPCAITH